MFELRDYQKKAHEETLKHIRESKDPAFLDVSVGGGKTVIIGALSKHVVEKGGKVLIIARQGELVEQGANTYREMGGKCSIYSASLNMRSKYYPVVFATEGTLCRELDMDFKDQKFNCLLIDEAHMVSWQDALLNEPETQYGKIIKHFKTLNPNLRIVGYTGSPFRKNSSMVGEFWSRKLAEVGTYELISKGYLVPPVFGFGDDDHSYDLSQWKTKHQQADFTQKELQAMGRKITKDATKTQLIMEEVIERTRDRLGVLITCASKKHCEQVAECLPDGSWGIITDSTPTKKRRELLAKAKTGEIKYMLQIGCLTTGVDISYWQVCVILRRIGSLVLLIQLIGRVLRTLKAHQIDEGLTKSDALILDYTDTLESMGDIYDDPILDKAKADKSTTEKLEVLCPKCETANSQYAVRCIGVDNSEDDGRCSHFFKYSECGICGTHNAPTARTCRSCDAVMIDPNRDLTRKAYTEAEYKPVIAMHFTTTKTGKLCVTYQLDSTYKKNGIEKPEVAREYYAVDSNQPHEKGRWYSFIKQHIQGAKFQQAMFKHRDLEIVIKNKAMFDVPTHITHRVGDKGFSIINRRKFRSGRESTAS